jgi:HEAT repeat protein
MFWSPAVISLLAVVGQIDSLNPYEHQVAKALAGLADPSNEVRAAAAESLGFLRAYSAEPPLIDRLNDPDAVVRRHVAMALGWCGGRQSVEPLLRALDDPQWLVRQAAYISLTNITGMEYAFDALGPPSERGRQLRRWRVWWASVPPDQPPKQVLQLIASAKLSAMGNRVLTSTTYRGPPDVLLDGQLGPAYWQTKNVPFPQWCTVDLGEAKEIGHVVVHQYGPEFVMTEYELATSLDNKQFSVVRREKRETPVTLELDFPPCKARYVRITSFGSKRPIYPTTFFEIEIGEPNRADALDRGPAEWRLERGLRALGALGGQGATEAALGVVGDGPSTAPGLRPAVRAGIRSLGRLREEAGFRALIRLLDDPFWARAAADALGDFGDPRAVGPLVAAYPRYAKNLAGADPPDVPADDKMGFPSEDRMLETPYSIAYALCRLPLGTAEQRTAIRQIAPLIMANLPGDHDTFMLYEPEVGHWLTRYLMNVAELRQQACEHAFEVLGQPRTIAAPGDSPAWSAFDARRISSWLPCVCTDRDDCTRLVALLKHENGWVRINAAKALAWLGNRRAVEPIAETLRQARREVEHGYSGTFKDEEYNDPAPRWREGLIRALGLLGADEHTELIAGILNDEGSVAEIRLAAAQALADLGNPQALSALQQAALRHPIHCVRTTVRDALREHGLDVAVGRVPQEDLTQLHRRANPHQQDEDSASIDAIVFIKGSNNIPNTIGTVEQADRWRQTYVVTDSGPAYRPGRNLYVLRPPRPDGTVTPLTRFSDGYIAEPELSWDGTHVIFCRRGQDDPWWHIWRISVDGTNLVQLTDGPYHEVGPAYLPDGRIVFASSRSGIRDEYHGYPCTSLHVMNPDGSDIHNIATNIGRDNEPVVLPDGRIVFSRLEVFYSRNKTELTLHAAHPDGVQDVVLYGPERRSFWRSLDHGPRTPADGQEAPLTHRVLRMTQPQPMPDGRGIVVVTQAGLALIGPRRDTETLISPDYKTRAYTTPYPLRDGRILCATALKTPDREQIDLGLYALNPETGELELIYNDPQAADFEPRPIVARRPPHARAPLAERHQYSGRFMCASVFNTQEKDVTLRGRYVRVIEGVPVVARHSTHTNPEPVWKNHGGTFARVLGTVPLAPDGSFFIEVPADRLLHHQVLDSDRRVVGNQLTWIYPRPGETKSCAGCHENPHTTTRGNDPLASHYPAVNLLPDGSEFTYRAKAWFKGRLPAEIEERTRTVRAVNLLGR